MKCAIYLHNGMCNLIGCTYCRIYMRYVYFCQCFHFASYYYTDFRHMCPKIYHLFACVLAECQDDTSLISPEVQVATIFLPVFSFHNICQLF